PILWLNARDLKILDVDPKAEVIDAQPNFVGLKFAQPLPAGASTLKLHWQGNLSRTEDQGLYRQQENGRWYAISQGEPLGMRRVISSFDETSFNLPWTISLRVTKSDAAFHNTPIESTEEAGDDKLLH